MKVKTTCANCGFDNSEDAKFCNNCGEKTNSVEKELSKTTENVLDENVEIDQNTEPPIIEIQPIENNKRDKKTLIKIVSGIVASAILITCVSVGGVKYKQFYDNKKAAKNVIEMIENIGEVSVNNECANKIYEASQAYNSLTGKQKEYVTNEVTLTKANQDYENSKASANLSVLAIYLKKNSALCQAFFSDYSGVWYNAIYRKTDEYNKGNFSDFNDALQAFTLSSTYRSAQKTLSDTNNMIIKTWSETISIPQNKQDLYDAIKNLYTAYQPMYALAAKPQGSYNSYTEETQRLNTAYKSAYASLAAVMPEIESLSN